MPDEGTHYFGDGCIPPHRDTELAEFFDNRTIGYKSRGEWTWRGSEYDSGWEEPTEAELAELARLLIARYPSVTDEGEQ